jgi:hypothetical protein
MEKMKKIILDESYEGQIKSLKKLLGLRPDQELDEFVFEEDDDDKKEEK